MPPFLPQSKLLYPDNADVSGQLSLLGDTIGRAIGDYRNQQRMQAIGDAAKGGNFEAARDAAFGAGRVDLGVKFQDTIDTKQNRAVDVAWRQQQADREQKNSDRNFGLKSQEFEFEKAHKSAELGLKRLALDFKNQGGFKDTKERSEVESGLRKEYTGLSKNFIEVSDAFGRIQASAKDPSAAGDLALIFNYMKMLDPGSTVREGEFATAQNSGGIPEQIRSQWNKAVSGERLSPNIRNDFLGRAQKLYATQEQSHKNLKGEFEKIGTRLGVDVQNVTPNFVQGGGAAVDWKTYFGGQK
jgi:hypothetical protein